MAIWINESKDSKSIAKVLIFNNISVEMYLEYAT